MLRRPVPALVAASVLLGASALGQTSPPAGTAGEDVPPVEIAMSVINDTVRCEPPEARFPSRNELDLRVVNGAERPLMFVAPDFLKSSRVISVAPMRDIEEGGFLVQGGESVRVILRTPAAGEYHYVCNQPGRPPNPDSSGFLIVGSPGE